LTSTNNLKQGIRGTVKEETGNRMPGPGRELPPPNPVQTTVYIYELTSLSQVVQSGTSPLYSDIKTRLVDSVATDREGNFALSLKPGNYSVFVRVDGKFFANSFDARNNIAPVTVEANRISEVNIVINDKASY
jgi:hypothetical protein